MKKERSRSRPFLRPEKRLSPRKPLVMIHIRTLKAHYWSAVKFSCFPKSDPWTLSPVKSLRRTLGSPVVVSQATCLPTTPRGSPRVYLYCNNKAVEDVTRTKNKNPKDPSVDHLRVLRTSSGTSTEVTHVLLRPPLGEQPMGYLDVPSRENSVPTVCNRVYEWERRGYRHGLR